MLKKNLPLYILVFLVLAAIIFLSPKIINFISADTLTPTGKELLVDNQFESQSFDNTIWTTATANANSTVTADSGAIAVTCGTTDGDFIKLSQKAPLVGGKFYQLSVSYDNTNLNPAVKAEFGFLKDGPSANVIESTPITLDPTSTSFSVYDTPQLNHDNSYFFFKCAGAGTINILDFSLEQFGSAPAGMPRATASPSATVAETANPSISSTSDTTVTQVPAVVAETAAAQTLTPAPTMTAQTELQTPTPIVNQVSLQSGWNIYGGNQDISSAAFTGQNMTVLQMFAGNWSKIAPSSKTSMILNHEGGIYIFNPSTSSKTVNINDANSASKLVAGRGWNILYNSSATDMTIDNLKYDFSSNGQTASYSLGDLLRQKHASQYVYLLKQASVGVGLTRIDLTQTNTIPAKTSFWFYVFSL